MSAPPADRDDDLLLRAVGRLPRLAPPTAVEARIAARAGAALGAAADRRRRLAERATRVARPLVPLSLGGLALGYLLWVCDQITAHLRW